MRILLIEDNPGDARLVQEMVREAAGEFTITVADKLRTGLELLRKENIDVVLLDLNLPDSRRLETFTRLQREFPHLPVVIMTGSGDETLGVRAVQLGAQDYLVKGQVDGRLLGRAVVYAVERKRADEELKENKQFLERLAQLNPALISVIDLTDNREIYSSKPGLVFLGYHPEEIEDATAFGASIMYPGDLDKMASAAAELKEANDDRIRNIEVRVKAADGRWRWFEILYVIFKRDRDGRPLQVMSVARDITERKEAEQLKDEFIGLVSHELRTPLTILVGSLSVADSEGVSPEDRRTLLEAAVSAAQSLGQIVDNLLELSRYQANRLALRKETVDMGAVIRRQAELRQTHEGDHPITVDIPEALEPVQVDKVRVNLVLANLISNAVKYSADGTEIRLRVRQEPGHQVISVTDQGIGIPVDKQTRLFQPFERLEETANETKGLGLGLLVCKRLVEAHGGRIWVESEAGKGATFYFSVPTVQGR